jgi:hypothetical protein
MQSYRVEGGKLSLGLRYSRWAPLMDGRRCAGAQDEPAEHGACW